MWWELSAKIQRPGPPRTECVALTEAIRGGQNQIDVVKKRGVVDAVGKLRVELGWEGFTWCGRGCAQTRWGNKLGVANNNNGVWSGVIGVCLTLFIQLRELV